MIHTPAELPGRSQGASRISQFWLALHWQTEEHHRAHKTELKQLSWNIKTSNLEMNATPFHAWTAHCTGCSQDKNLFIEKNTWQPRDRKYYCRRCGTYWKDHRVLPTHLCTGDLIELLPTSCSLPPFWWQDKFSPPDLQLTEHWGHRVRNCQCHQDNQPWTIISQTVPHESARPHDSRPS